MVINPFFLQKCKKTRDMGSRIVKKQRKAGAEMRLEEQRLLVDALQLAPQSEYYIIVGILSFRRALCCFLDD